MTSQLPTAKKRVFAATISAALLFSLAACSTETTGGEAPDPSDPVAGPPGIEMVPEEARDAYEGAELFVKLQENPYKEWTPPEGPTTWCLSESYTGNTFRKLHLAAWQELVAELKADGLATEELRVTDSNRDAALQISQINTLVNGGCDVLIVLPASPDGLCEVMSQAKERGVLVLTSDSVTDCADVINVSHNGFVSMKANVLAVAEKIGGEGTALVVTGVPGTKGVAYLTAAIESALEDYPDIEIVGEVAGNWTPSVAQSAVATFLATHPGEIDAIFEMGEMGTASQNALKQAGRDLAVTTAAAGECSAFAFWKANPEAAAFATVQSPDGIAYETYAVARRMLAGQQPSLNTILYKLPEVSQANFDEFYDPSMTEASLCYPRTADGRAVPDSFLDAFFTGGEPVETKPAL